MKFQNCLRAIGFLKGEEFWCSECDNKKVYSDKPETGKFFNQFGHNWIPQVGNTPGKIGDDYNQIIFALCAECLAKGGYVEPDGDDMVSMGASCGLSIGKVS
jgi:hypothetical protein